MAYLTLDVDSVDPDCLYLADAVPNAVLPRGEFYRVCYSNETITLRGVYVVLPCQLLHGQTGAGWKNCRAICKQEDLKKIGDVERTLTSLVPGAGARWNSKLKDTLVNGPIRFSDHIPRDKVKQVVIKISGVWTTNGDSGVTYKLIPAT